MRRSPRTQFATAVALATMLVAAPAWAQEEGVTLDPSDPAAKEYALPVEQARREAAGEGDQAVVQGSRASGTFGEGVTPDAEKPDPAGSANADAPASTPPAAADSGGSGSDPVDRQATASSGLSSTTALVGGGIAALVAAGLGGIALRAVRGPGDA